MKHFVAASCLVCVILLTGTSTAQALDQIFVKGSDKGIDAVIESESIKGIKAKGRELIPAETIQDVSYEVEPLEVRLGSYRPATVSEKAAMNAATDEDRIKHLTTAIQKFEEASLKVKGATVKRHLAYKVAYLQALKAKTDGKDNSAILAIVRLKEFKNKYPDSWQLPHALITLANLQSEQKNYEDAESTLSELAKAPVSEGIRQDAELKIAQMSMKSGNYAKAQEKLAALAAKLPKDSSLAQRARLSQAECMAATKNFKGAQDMLKKFLVESRDKDLRAAAYNTLGYCYYMTDQLDELREARWAFLWVDVVYNQNKTEHAKALYYLWRIFNRLNDPARGQECWEALVNDPQFAGTEWQAKAKQEREKGS